MSESDQLHLDLVYFAWVREAIGLDGERIDHPGEGVSVAGVIAQLVARGAGYVEVFADQSRMRAALDQRFVTLDQPIGNAGELALFPPVTGG